MNKELIINNNIISFDVITHYEEDDQDCIGDYLSIEIKHNNKTIKTFGDYYHDKGNHQLSGFFKGIRYIIDPKIEIEINYIDIADGQC